MGAMASQITGVSIGHLVICLSADQISESIKVPYHCPFWGESTCYQWIPLAKGQ